MKGIYRIVIALGILVCMGCSQDYVCPSLENALEDYMSRHHYDLYSISITNLDSVEILTIDGKYAYDKYLTDGYFFVDGKLVVYCFMDRKSRPDIIYQNRTTLFHDTIPGYAEQNSVLANFEPSPEEYQIVSPETIYPIDDTEPLTPAHREANDSNVIRMKPLSNALNAYINKYSANLYELFFKKTDTGIDVYISAMPSYDKEQADGYFYRNGYLVVLYGTDLIKDYDVLDSNGINRNVQSIPHVRHAHHTFRHYPYTEKYHIKR